MRTPSQRTFTHAAAILGAGLFALGGTSLVPPLRSLERHLVRTLAMAVDPMDTIIDGRGSQKEPWTRRKATRRTPPPPPRFLNIDDDPEGYFSSSPLSPVDHALIFARLADAGHKVLGVGHLMAWEEPEPLAMLALRKQLDRFDAAVLALPLARGAAAEPVPAAFLRMSLPVSEVTGDPSSFPLVNRLAIPNAEQGGARGLAGFSLLENEADPGDGRRHLLARWNDRVIFSFPLATEIAALGIDPAEVRIHAAKEIRLGAGGPVIGIDEFGRAPVAQSTAAEDIPAMRLISEKNPAPPAAQPLLTRDLRGDLPEAEMAWSESLPGTVHSLRAAPHFEAAVSLPRPDALVELLLVSLLAFAGTVAAGLRNFAARMVAGLLVAGLGVEFLYLFASRQNAWLPPLAMLCPGLIALGLSFRTTAALAAEAEDRREAVTAPEPPGKPAPATAPDRSPPAAGASARPEVIPLPGTHPVTGPAPPAIKRIRLREILPLEKPAVGETPPAPAGPGPAESKIKPARTARKSPAKGAARKTVKTAKKTARKPPPKPDPEAPDTNE